MWEGPRQSHFEVGANWTDNQNWNNHTETSNLQTASHLGWDFYVQAISSPLPGHKKTEILRIIFIRRNKTKQTKKNATRHCDSCARSHNALEILQKLMLFRDKDHCPRVCFRFNLKKLDLFSFTPTLYPLRIGTSSIDVHTHTHTHTHTHIRCWIAYLTQPQVAAHPKHTYAMLQDASLCDSHC